MRTTSKGYYRRDKVRVLERNGVVVELVRTHNPGYLTYEDENQVAAIPFSDR